MTCLVPIVKPPLDRCFDECQKHSPRSRHVMLAGSHGTTHIFLCNRTTRRRIQQRFVFLGRERDEGGDLSWCTNLNYGLLRNGTLPWQPQPDLEGNFLLLLNRSYNHHVGVCIDETGSWRTCTAGQGPKLQRWKYVRKKQKTIDTKMETAMWKTFAGRP